MDKVTYVGNADVNAIEHLYQSYTKDPQSVDIGWQKFFEGFEVRTFNAPCNVGFILNKKNCVQLEPLV